MYDDCMESPRVCYGDDGTEFEGATFIRICPKCGRFVRADKKVQIFTVSEKPCGTYLPNLKRSEKPNATCKKCGRVAMPFEGFI